MNNVVDRVPTQVLANGAVRYETFSSNGTSQGYIWIKRADEPSVEGTPLNKTLFDSIKTDIDNLLNRTSEYADSNKNFTMSDTTQTQHTNTFTFATNGRRFILFYLSPFWSQKCVFLYDCDNDAFIFQLNEGNNASDMIKLYPDSITLVATGSGSVYQYVRVNSITHSGSNVVIKLDWMNKSGSTSSKVYAKAVYLGGTN